MVRLQAIVSAGEISRKPQILTERFQRLCTAFKLDPGQIDNSEGNCSILIGLKAQSIQTTRICSFKSDEFKEVGVYQSPILRKFLFVGEDLQVDDHGTVLVTVNNDSVDLPDGSSFSSQTTFDVKLHNFIEIEKSVPLQDIHCEACR